MDHSTNSPWISRLAKLCVLLTFCLILLGAIVTTSGAGMAAPAAPHVDGTLLNPTSPVTQTAWWKDPALLREHGHRLVAMSLGLAVGALAAALWRNWIAFAISVVFMGAADGLRSLKLDPALIAQLRIWPAMILFITLLIVGTRRRGEKPSSEQWMALIAYIAACAQALLGSLRVNLETGGSIIAATNIRTFHGIFAQAFLAFLVILAARLSPLWGRLTTPLHAAGKIRRMAVIAMLLYFAQISCAAYLRHRNLGLVIASWPAAQSDPGWSLSGNWLPAAWSHAMGIHFLHTRILAVLLLGHLAVMGVSLMKRARSEPLLAPLGPPLAALTAVQFALGVLVVTLYVHGVPRQPHITNTHVITGALLIAIVALIFTRAGRLRAA
jgi:heme A synthase